ncbi:low molecular weight protein-tyrosine-phosphatase [Pseudomonas saliphila]|uniref:low molecular weight protein-tyrosine-phosphatase n=1 Tax=Pseudomonas saliphila TaxID=2586906 RepID=UPI001239473D|nr:low molecular weight protein-tyrosine-phosphatase [Pseudomonas saliphila]
MRVLFVCLGNICRSPSAQGVFEKLLAADELAGSIKVDSAGTADYHIGKPPDRRAITAASRRGVDISMLSARRVADSDFAEFDLILAADHDNLQELMRRAPADCAAKLRLFMSYAPDDGEEIPDPYYGGEQGFEDVLDMLERASQGLLASLREHPQSPLVS